MGRTRRVIGTIALLAGAVTMADMTPVDAGAAASAGPITVWIDVAAADAQSVYDGLTVELRDDSSSDILSTGVCTNDGGSTFQLGRNYRVQFSCAAALYGDYTLVVDGVPSNRELSANCFPTGATSADLVHSSSSNCSVYVYGPMLIVDKIVPNGPSTAPDFELEAYLGDGGSPYATFTDPSNSLCNPDTETFDPATCAIVDIEMGDWQLGELTVPGYGAVAASCESGWDFYEERLTDTLGQFTVDDVWHWTYCTVTNTYTEGQLVVDASVVNDDGGTAAPTDIQVEVYPSGGGSPVVSATACAGDGSCLDVMLPSGDYVIGYIGPDGYTREITQTVVPVEVPTEMVTDDADAAFSAAPTQRVEIAVAIDDPVTTTTTLAPTTTAAPTTTIAPTTTNATTTSIDAGVVTLPQTGSREGNQALIALVLVVAGGALLLIRRRRPA